MERGVWRQAMGTKELLTPPVRDFHTLSIFFRLV